MTRDLNREESTWESYATFSTVIMLNQSIAAQGNVLLIQTIFYIFLGHKPDLRIQLQAQGQEGINSMKLLPMNQKNKWIIKYENKFKGILSFNSSNEFVKQFYVWNLFQDQ